MMAFSFCSMSVSQSVSQSLVSVTALEHGICVWCTWGRGEYWYHDRPAERFKLACRIFGLLRLSGVTPGQRELLTIQRTRRRCVNAVKLAQGEIG